jgi:MFS family permease
MMWQMWTAFGIMLGYVADLAFLNVPNKPHITGLNWRLMLASAGIPALIVIAQVFFCPESPRWLMSKGRYAEAYRSLERLRSDPLLASRDLYCESFIYFYCLTGKSNIRIDIHVLLEVENSINRGNRLKELFTIPRNRRAALYVAFNPKLEDGVLTGHFL